ncbi:amidohydrolase family protein [Microbacterium rhizosphaerae]|uniref:Amidohydrolase family protein n=1 Tax=Microbacterium rhizosphaerae TaxID=1678237 RepID=A0ABZ0SJX3_9MICO|nr:amidohydrolase family protein [Microbacterium rhizosphaerae]WPR89125.1 amidohydrolase family protein [Microbacterium rhizosphaerae]
MVVIDAHQHVWDLEQVSYPWLTPETGILRRTYAIEELIPDLDACGVDATILVQAADSVEDTRWMQRVAARHPRVAGIVGWVPLEDPARAADLLDDYASDPRIVGIRHLIHNEPDGDWLVRPAVQDGLALLAERGLTFDVVAVNERHLRHVSTIAKNHPSLRLVIDHLGKPPIAAGEWMPWAGALAEAAEGPNVYAKLSGLNTAAAAGWAARDLAPYVDHAFEVFGAERLMYGGDWPVTLLAGDYRSVWQATAELLAERSEAERAAVLGGTAASFYRIDERALLRPSTTV